MRVAAGSPSRKVTPLRQELRPSRAVHRRSPPNRPYRVTFNGGVHGPGETPTARPCVFKLAMVNQQSMQYLGEVFTGMTTEEFTQALKAGGRNFG